MLYSLLHYVITPTKNDNRHYTILYSQLHQTMSNVRSYNTNYIMHGITTNICSYNTKYIML